MVKLVVPLPVPAEEAPASEQKRNSRRKKAKLPEPKLAEYKHFVPGLIFLKYSETFEEHGKHLERQSSNSASKCYIDKSPDRDAMHENRDESTASNILWLSQGARRAYSLSCFEASRGYSTFC